MKNIILFSFLSIWSCGNIIAQDYAYEITSEAGDSTFQLDVITIINAARQSIQRTIGLDTASLQSRQYTEINNRYERRARLEREGDNLQREITVLSASLNSLSLNQYVQWQVERNDSTFLDDARYLDETATLINCYVMPRDNLVPIIKRDSDNSNVATITFFSRNYIRLNWVAGNEPPSGETQTFFSSSDGFFFVGYDKDGNRHRITFIN